MSGGEGTGHHSMIKYGGQWYAVYHAAHNVEQDGLGGRPQERPIFT